MSSIFMVSPSWFRGSCSRSASEFEDAEERCERAHRRAGQPRDVDEALQVIESRAFGDDEQKSVAAERIAKADERVQIAGTGARIGEPDGEIERLPWKWLAGVGVPGDYAGGGEEVDHLVPEGVTRDGTM